MTLGAQHRYSNFVNSESAGLPEGRILPLLMKKGPATGPDPLRLSLASRGYSILISASELKVMGDPNPPPKMPKRLESGVISS